MCQTQAAYMAWGKQHCAPVWTTACYSSDSRKDCDIHTPEEQQPFIMKCPAGNRVVVRCMAPKLTEVALPFQFQPNKWYHVIITHSTGSALSSSVVRMFVDGNLEASSRFKYVKVWQGMLHPIPQYSMPCCVWAGTLALLGACWERPIQISSDALDVEPPSEGFLQPSMFCILAARAS